MRARRKTMFFRTSPQFLIKYSHYYSNIFTLNASVGNEMTHLSANKAEENEDSEDSDEGRSHDMSHDRCMVHSHDV